MSNSFSIPAVDLVEELSGNAERYACAKKSLLEDRSRLPSHITHCLDTIISAADPAPDIDTTIVCSVTHGMEIIRRSPPIKELLSLREILKEQLQKIEYRDIEEIIGFRSLSPSDITGESPIPNKFGGAYIRLPPRVKDSVRHLAANLDASDSVIAMVSIVEILSHQKVLPHPFRKSLDRRIQSFWRKASLRSTIAKMLLANLAS